MSLKMRYPCEIKSSALWKGDGDGGGDGGCGNDDSDGGCYGDVMVVVVMWW